MYNWNFFFFNTTDVSIKVKECVNLLKHFNDYVTSKASFFLDLTDFKTYCNSVASKCIMMPFSVTGAFRHQPNSEG